MRVLDNGDAGSARGAAILVPDTSKTFDPSRNAIGSARAYGTGGARVKDFRFEQKAHPGAYETRDFREAKSNAAAQRKYATREANTRGKYAIPNTAQDAGNKTAATRDAWDGSKVAATRDLSDGNRPYLGPESKKLNTSVDQTKEAGWKGDLKPLSIDDVRTLLNKNK